METFEDLLDRYINLALNLWRWSGVERGAKMREEMKEVRGKLLELHREALFKLAWLDAHTKDYYTPED